ncbi:hypothetical protein [Dysgonomonas macrotermitis]|uniref:Uncharacterized protein n=1 Tax=Dysgonomonas macrotermitis TaxID=1346286 RepID=A0A1M5CGV1_9BACT|nr:hypothetical protein [Dysgonomonas macrotermitis]SHF53993.1 hypothetical protein SAMN05444362_107167 [Dysgonomonas macrotermitis]
MHIKKIKPSSFFQFDILLNYLLQIVGKNVTASVGLIRLWILWFSVSAILLCMPFAILLVATSLKTDHMNYKKGIVEEAEDISLSGFSRNGHLNMTTYNNFKLKDDPIIYGIKTQYNNISIDQLLFNYIYENKRSPFEIKTGDTIEFYVPNEIVTYQLDSNNYRIYPERYLLSKLKLTKNNPNLKIIKTYGQTINNERITSIQKYRLTENAGYYVLFLTKVLLIISSISLMLLLIMTTRYIYLRSKVSK